jgi:hypothetical protein
MGVPISLRARQRFRQRLHNIEDADEILNALNEFIERFTLISGEFSSTNWETIYEYELENNSTVMMTFSIIGKENNNRAGLKRTSVFYKDLGNVQAVKIEQSDFSSKSNDSFNARLFPDGNVVKLQVRGATNNLTKWMGSVEIERLGE